MKKKLPNRNEVRATYESGKFTHKEIAERFKDKGYSISYKTVEKWSGDDGWKKNSYDSFEVAMSHIKHLEEAESTNSKNEDEVIQQTLSNDNLIREVANNLKRAKDLAEKSGTIQSNKIYQEMLLKVYDRTNSDGQILLKKDDWYSSFEKDIKNMSQEELIKLSKTIK